MHDDDSVAGAQMRADAMELARDYGNLHDAIQRLLELNQASTAYGDPRVAPYATVTELTAKWRELGTQINAALAQVSRVNAALALRRCRLLGEHDPDGTGTIN